jgi:N-dimethylarginine dimethylaminohydrolase
MMSVKQTTFKPQFNRQVLMSGAEYMSNALAINPYMDASEPFDVAKAVAQHTGIRQALESIGIEVIKRDAPKDCQDAVFTANEALLGIDDQTILMARLPKGREQETPYFEQLFRELHKTILYLPNPDWYFSGQGDALRYGDYLLAGQKFRTTPGPDVHQFIRDNLGYNVISLQAKALYNTDGSLSVNAVTGLPNSEFYDIDYAIAPIKWPTATERGLLVVCREAFEPESLEQIQALPNTDIIWAPYEEATGVSACNLVATGEAVVMNAGAPVLEQALRDRSLHVITTVNDELKKNGGSVRCTTVTTQHLAA